MRNIKPSKILIKIGTNTITDENGMLDLGVMQNLVNQICRIRNSRKKIIIVTSGAIGAGMQELGWKEKPKDVIGKQVCAAIGQSILMANYHSLFEKYNVRIAQTLLTYSDFSNKKTYANFRNSIEKLLDLGVIPIINENDPISIDEIGPSFGDNDMLSALIASKMKVDLMVILTNVAGLFDRYPIDKDAVLIKEVKNINKKIESIGGAATRLGIGGMKSKLKAAKLATKAGAIVVIADGSADNVLIRILNNEDIGTIFYQK